MSAIGHYLERESIATTGISLIREHTERMRPPRSLWVPFVLGRPLGAPGDAAFQHRVLDAAFALLEYDAPPVLADFAEEAPIDLDDGATPWACPVSFPAPASSNLAAQVRDEMARLSPWYDIATRRRGHSTVGISAMPLNEALELVLLCHRREETVDVPDGRTLRSAIEDLKVFYQEAMTARPGSGMSPDSVLKGLWNETALGRLLREVAARGVHSENEALRYIAAQALVPRSLANDVVVE